MILYLEGISGGVAFEKFDFGGSLGQRAWSQGAGRTTYKASLGDINIVRNADKSSNELVAALVNGKKFPTGKITYKSAYLSEELEKKIQTVHMTLRNAMINNISVDKSIETVSIACEGIDYEVSE